MKYIQRIVLLTVVLFFPLVAQADSLTYQEAYGRYLYDFHLSYANGHLVQDGIYTLSTGDAPAFPTGPWTVTILDSRVRTLWTQSIDPAGLNATGGELLMKYYDSGTMARFSGPGGASLDIDLRGSRVCDDNGVCGTQYGESADNCPGDCGSVAQEDVQGAAIANGAGLAGTLGAWMLRLSFAAAGLLLVAGASVMLDNRRGQ